MPDLANLQTLTDDEIRDLATRVTRLANVDAVDSIRALLADWALTVRIRSHPDFDRNAELFREVVATEMAPATS